MAYRSDISQFDRLYTSAVSRCNAILCFVQSLQSFYRTEDDAQISHDLTHLQGEIDTMRKLHNAQKFNGSDSEQRLRLHDLQDKLEQKSLDFEDASKKINKYQEEIVDLTAIVEDLRAKLASKYKETKDFDSAAQQYQALIALKAKEKEMLPQKDLSDTISNQEAKSIETVELSYKYDYGKMLVDARNYRDAENIFDDVLERRKELYKDPKIRRGPTRETQLELCNALRLQKSLKKLSEAADLCYEAGSLENLDFQEADYRTWAIRNAFNLACVRIELGRYSDAIDQLNQVWPRRHRAFSEYIEEMEAEIARILENLEQQEEGAWADLVLKTVIGSDRNVSRYLVGAMADIGLRLHKESQNDRGIEYIRTAWTISSSRGLSDESLSLGWSLACSLCQAKGFDAAKDVLKNLLKFSDTETYPSKHQVKALFAYTQFVTGEFRQAKQTAQNTYDQHKAKHILRSHGHHHADTLILATLKEKYYKGKWKTTVDVWNQIYKNARNLPLASSGDRDQLEHHATTGIKLAQEWRRWRRTRGQPDAPGADKVKRQAHKLRERARIDVSTL